MTHFLVVVPSFNAMPWLPTCLASIAAQDHRDFDVIVIDDASTVAGEAEYVQRTCAARGWEWILNDENRKMPRNLWTALGSGGDPNEVVVIVDGDDWLPHDQTLTRLAAEYADPEVWLTWGSYTRYPDPSYMPNPAGPFPDDVMRDRSFRSYQSNPYNHPLTFRRFLWEGIQAWELQDGQGEWFRAGYDIAIMMPMLEMAGALHCRWLPETLYVYNESNVISDAKIRPEECNRVHSIVRGRSKRDRLIR